MEWAMTQNNLGTVYADMGEVEKAKEHFQNAIRGYAGAGLPSDWEGRAYAERRLRELEAGSSLKEKRLSRRREEET